LYKKRFSIGVGYQGVKAVQNQAKINAYVKGQFEILAGRSKAGDKKDSWQKHAKKSKRVIKKDSRRKTPRRRAGGHREKKKDWGTAPVNTTPQKKDQVHC